MLKRAGLPAQVIGEPPLFDVVFSSEEIRDYRGTLRGDAELLAQFNKLLRERGIMKGESKYYVSLAHHRGRHPSHLRGLASAIDELVRMRKGRG